MTEQEQNEMICRDLFKWKESSILGYWYPSNQHVGTVSTPIFSTWADAGAILEALQVKARGGDVHADFICDDLSARLELWDLYPDAIRNAALAYLQAAASPSQSAKGE